MYPIDEFERMHDEIDSMFSRMFGMPSKPKLPAKTNDFRPAVSDCYETENSVVTCFELPGADKKDIDLKVTDNYIEVKVEKKVEQEKKEEGYTSYAVGTSQFYRKQRLPSDVDADNAKASYKNGVLKVEIPKKTAQKKRKIKIE